MERLDNYSILPSGMKAYLENYGWHFSKRMYEFAVSNMHHKNKQNMMCLGKDEIQSIFTNNGITIKSKGYDAEYVYMMCMYDFYGSSIKNINDLLQFVKDYIEDEDGYDGIAFTRFYSDCIAKGIPLIWEDLI